MSKKKYVELLLQQIEISKKNNCLFPICSYPKEEGRKETNPIGYYFVTHNSHPLVHNNIPFKVQIFSSIAATKKCLAIINCKTACIYILHLAVFVFAAVILPRHRKSISKHTNAMVCCRLAFCVCL